MVVILSPFKTIARECIRTAATGGSPASVKKKSTDTRYDWYSLSNEAGVAVDSSKVGNLFDASCFSLSVPPLSDETSESSGSDDGSELDDAMVAEYNLATPAQETKRKKPSTTPPKTPTWCASPESLDFLSYAFGCISIKKPDRQSTDFDATNDQFADSPSRDVDGEEPQSRNEVPVVNGVQHLPRRNLFNSCASPDNKKQRIDSDKRKQRPQEVDPEEVLLPRITRGRISALMNWRDRDDDYKAVEEKASKRKDNNLTFKRAVGVLVSLDVGVFIERLRSILEDEWVGKRFFNHQSIQDLMRRFGVLPKTKIEDFDAIESLKEFVKDHSREVTENGGGTRKKENHEACETVLMALMWNKDKKYVSKVAKIFPHISYAFVSNVWNAMQQGLHHCGRKTRKDAIRNIAGPLINQFCHDDIWTRSDTSNGGQGGTWRAFINCTLWDGTKEKHSRRIWNCSTLEEKYELFKRTSYYRELVQRVEETVPRKNPRVLAAAALLRSKLQEKYRFRVGKPLTIKQLRKFLDDIEVPHKQLTTYAKLTEVAYRKAFGAPWDTIPLEVIKKYRQEPIGLTFFEELLCRCVRNPHSKSCVDETFTQIQEYQKALWKAWCHNQDIKELFETCPCDNCKLRRNRQDGNLDLEEFVFIEDLIGKSYFRLLEATFCDRESYPLFRNVLDQEDPLLIRLECLDDCPNCGFENNLNDPLSCPIWRECDIQIPVLEYAAMERSGTDSSGKQRTQKELVMTSLEVREILTNLIKIVNEKGREHFLYTIWTNRAIENMSLFMCHDYVFVNIDYGATFNLVPLHKLNCHENRHCVDLVFMVQCNPRDVAVYDENGEFLKYHRINDTIAVHGFADTISKGKKTDAFMIKRMLEEMILILDEKYFKATGRNMSLKRLHIASDNCKSQNKCCNHFWNCATLCEGLVARRYLLDMQTKPVSDAMDTESSDCHDSIVAGVNSSTTSSTACESGTATKPVSDAMDTESTDNHDSTIAGDSRFMAIEITETLTNTSSQDESAGESAATEVPPLESLDPKTLEGMNGYHLLDKFKETYGPKLPTDFDEKVEKLYTFEIRQNYTEKSQGKGKHDGDSGLMKRMIVIAVLRGATCKDATDVFKIVTEKLGHKSELREMIPNLAEMEKENDYGLLKIHSGTITHRLNLLFLENKEAVRILRELGYQFVYEIDRINPSPTTATVPNTNQFREIYFPKPDLQVEERVMQSSDLSCGCYPCVVDFNSPNCLYKANRCVSIHTMKPVKKTTPAAGSSSKKTRRKTQTSSPETEEAAARIAEFCKLPASTKLTIQVLKDLSLKHANQHSIDLKSIKPPKKGRALWIQFAHKIFFPEAPEVNVDFLTAAPTEEEDQNENEVPSHRSAPENVAICDDKDDPGADDDVDDIVDHFQVGLVGLDNIATGTPLNGLDSVLHFLSASQYFFIEVVALLGLQELQPLHIEIIRIISQLNTMCAPLLMSLKLFTRLFEDSFPGAGGFQLLPLDLLSKIVSIFGNTLKHVKIDSLLSGEQRGFKFSTFLNVQVSSALVSNQINQYLRSNELSDQSLPPCCVLKVERDLSSASAIGGLEAAPLELSFACGEHRNRRIYKLRAMINKDEANYVAHIKRASDDSGFDWIRWDGHLCQRVSEEYVQRQSETAYMLLYEYQAADLEELMSEASDTSLLYPPYEIQDSRWSSCVEQVC